MRGVRLLFAAALPGVAAAMAITTFAQEHHHHPPSPSPSPSSSPGSGYAEMGRHMRVTVKRAERAGDRDRARRLVEETRRVIEPYRDHHEAVADGYQPFLAQLPLPEYHFTNYRHGFKASFLFDAEQPTSLLYVREGGDYRLTGVMFTAAAAASLDELDSRVPLSMAQWHRHTSICLPPKGRGVETLGKNARFGFDGSIATAEECDTAGGRFFPRLFGWMVHVYPFEKRLEDTFRMPGHHRHQGEGEGGPHDHGGHPHEGR
jgi:hypothetical protein